MKGLQTMKTTTMRLAMLVAVFATIGLVLAGTLDPPGAPAPTMVTLQQIYDKIGAGAVGVPKTGQSGCWDVNGTPIACAGTGQDGEYQNGTSVSPRFTDSLNGTVKDNLTGLIWLKNANCFGGLPWTSALTAANTLASGACGLTDGSVAGNWRMPNIKELLSLFDYNQTSLALPPGNPFTGVQSQIYYSSSTNTYNRSYAWCADPSYAGTIFASKTGGTYSWPVRNGR